MSKKVVLNIGAGKIDFDKFKDYGLVIHVDRFFSDNSVDICDAEGMWEHYNSKDTSATVGLKTQHIYCKSDIFEFVDTFRYKFDLVFAERIFEHMEYVSGEIGRLLEAINTLTTKDGELQIIVPNFHTLSKMLIAYEEEHESFNHLQSLNTKLILNTEFCNIKVDPHASVWTPRLAKEYIESEGTWRINDLRVSCLHEGRDIYMKIVCDKGTSEEL